MTCSSPGASSRCPGRVAPGDIRLSRLLPRTLLNDRVQRPRPRPRPYKKGTRDAVTSRLLRTQSDAVGTQSMNSRPDPLIMQDCDSVTIRGAPLLAATYRAVLQAIARRRRDGLPSHDLQTLAQALYRAHMSPPRHELATIADHPPCSTHQSACDWCDVAEAANILRLSRRQVQRMARDPGGLDATRVGRIWLLRRAPLLVLARERRNDRADGLPRRVEARDASDVDTRTRRSGRARDRCFHRRVEH